MRFFFGLLQSLKRWRRADDIDPNILDTYQKSVFEVVDVLVGGLAAREGQCYLGDSNRIAVEPVVLLSMDLYFRICDRSKS